MYWGFPRLEPPYTERQGKNTPYPTQDERPPRSWGLTASYEGTLFTLVLSGGARQTHRALPSIHNGNSPLV